MNLNRESLKRIAGKSETAEAVFTILGARERARTDIDLRRLRNELIDEGFKMIPTEFTAVFEELAKAGIGELKKQKGKPSRFAFHVNPIEVGKLGIDGRPARPHLSVIKAEAAPVVVAAEEEKQVTTVVQTETGPGLKVVAAMLGIGRSVEIKLPANLSIQEARFLADTILRQASE